MQINEEEKNISYHNVTNCFSILLDQILRKKDIQEKYILIDKNDLL